MGTLGDPPHSAPGAFSPTFNVFFLPGKSPTSPFHIWATILAVVPKVVQGVWDSGGMMSAGRGPLQSPGWDPKAPWTPQTRVPLRWET